MANSSPEFELIKRHFTRPAANAVLGVGDDCALVDVTNGLDLAGSPDPAGSVPPFPPASAGLRARAACALVRVPNGVDPAVSTDTMVSGTHFFPDVNPENLGHKA